MFSNSKMMSMFKAMAGKIRRTKWNDSGNVQNPQNRKELSHILKNNKFVLMECFSGVTNTCKKHEALMRSVKRLPCSSGIVFVRARELYLKGIIEGLGVETCPVYIFFQNGREKSRLIAINLTEIDIYQEDDDLREMPLEKGKLKTELVKWLGNIQATLMKKPDAA